MFNPIVRETKARSQKARRPGAEAEPVHSSYRIHAYENCTLPPLHKANEQCFSGPVPHVPLDHDGGSFTCARNLGATEDYRGRDVVYIPQAHRNVAWILSFFFFIFLVFLFGIIIGWRPPGTSSLMGKTV